MLSILNLNLKLQVCAKASFSLLLIFLDATHHINQLWELELELDGDGVRDVHDGSDELVVGGEQVIKQPLGIRVTRGVHWNTQRFSSQWRYERLSWGHQGLLIVLQIIIQKRFALVDTGLTYREACSIVCYDFAHPTYLKTIVFTRKSLKSELWVLDTLAQTVIAYWLLLHFLDTWQILSIPNWVSGWDWQWEHLNIKKLSTIHIWN